MAAIAYDPITTDQPTEEEQPSIYLSREEIARQYGRINVSDEGQITYYLSNAERIPVEYDRWHAVNPYLYAPVDPFYPPEYDTPPQIPAHYSEMMKAIRSAADEGKQDARAALIALACDMYHDPCVLADLLYQASRPKGWTPNDDAMPF